MRIRYINNDGAGFAGDLDVADGTTAGQLFRDKMGDTEPLDYRIRVNGQPATADQVLVHNDRVSITPRHLKGA